MSFFSWPDHTGIVAAVLEFWIGSIPVISGVGAWVKKVTERRHREKLAQQAEQHRQTLAVLQATKGSG